MLNLSTLQTQLSRLHSPDALRELFANWSYEADFAPVYLGSATKGDEAAQNALADEPQILARAGEFEIIYAPLKDWQRAIGGERLVISRLLNDHPFALWIFSDQAGQNWHFVNVKRGAGKGKAAMSRHVLRRFSFERGQLPGRTSLEQLLKIDVAPIGVLPGMAPAALAVQARHDEAFDVEAVTRNFFRDYKLVFEQVEAKVIQSLPDDNAARLWTQRLFNRLMFLRFLEKKGWLEYNGDKNYLRALFNEARAQNENFLDDRLFFSFFFGLNMPESDRALHGDEKLQKVRGQVPFLNGGLFEQVTDSDVQGRIKLENAVFAPILDLFDQYNFTIHESTPFDQEIGVDPEMLGKVFEELVTGRHESGSYYTPRGIVSFMGREALKGYLEKFEAPQALALFVDEGDASALRDPERVLEALREVKICDPACGSGAYLLGMMQELLRLREALFAVPTIKPESIYKLKLNIIESNLYGVDKDLFAVNIAMLRLWLSLIIEFQGEKPPALPNLGYKIGCGDSLSAPLIGASQLVMHDNTLREFVGKKGDYLRAHGAQKKNLQAEIESLRAEIRLWTHSGQQIDGFDWVVDFAEVFASAECGVRNAECDSALATPHSALDSGFDIVLANPPYVRQELITEQKAQLKTIFGSNFSGTADLYVFFYLRGHQLLKDGGMLAYISPNKWFRAAYGAKMRKHFAENAAVRSITDFGDLPVFQSATAYPMIFVAQKSPHPTSPGGGGVLPSLREGLGEGKSAPIFTQVKSLDEPYPDVRALMEQSGAVLPPGALDGENWNLSDAKTAARLHTMRKSGVPLGEYVKGQIFYGVKTGFNKAFVIDGATRDSLIKADKNSAELIKPLVAGREIRKWAVDYKEKWLIFTRRGTDIEKYPAIKAHLEQWKAELTPKTAGATIGRKPGRYKWFEIQDDVAYYAEFDKPKILFQIFQVKPAFALDRKGVFTNNAAYIMPIEDLYLLGFLNSESGWHEITRTCSKIQNGYQLMWKYFQKVIIPTASSGDKTAIEELVAACLAKKGVNCEAEEVEINARVAKLYGITAG